MTNLYVHFNVNIIITFLYSKCVYIMLNLYIYIHGIRSYYVKKMSNFCQLEIKSKTNFFLEIKTCDFIL
jgi:hypothetical protein